MLESEYSGGDIATREVGYGDMGALDGMMIGSVLDGAAWRVP